MSVRSFTRSSSLAPAGNVRPIATTRTIAGDLASSAPDPVRPLRVLGTEPFRLRLADYTDVVAVVDAAVECLRGAHRDNEPAPSALIIVKTEQEEDAVSTEIGELWTSIIPLLETSEDELEERIAR